MSLCMVNKWRGGRVYPTIDSLEKNIMLRGLPYTDGKKEDWQQEKKPIQAEIRQLDEDRTTNMVSKVSC